MGLVTESPNRGEMCILVVFVFILIVSLGGFLLGVFNVLGRDLFKCSHLMALMSVSLDIGSGRCGLFILFPFDVLCVWLFGRII